MVLNPSLGVSLVAGHGEWWRRQVEQAIATANGAADLQVRLQHLHELLRQPYDEIDRFSPCIVAFLICQFAFLANGIIRISMRPAIDCSAAAASDCLRDYVSNYFGAVVQLSLALYFFPTFLFFMGSVGESFERSKRALQCPKVCRPPLSPTRRSVRQSAALVVNH